MPLVVADDFSEVAEDQLRAFSRELRHAIDGADEADLPPGVRRAITEARNDGESLKSFFKWRTLHPERAKEFEQADVSTTKRQLQFEDDGTVNSLLVAFMRDVRIRAQSIERAVPPGMHAKVVHIMRHGQGFHNMLEGQPGMEGVVTPAKLQHEDVDGTPCIVAAAFDDIYTERMGPRTVVGMITKGVPEFAAEYSDDYGSTWTEMPPVEGERKEGSGRVLLTNSVECTHVRLRLKGAAPSNEPLVQLLVPVLARHELIDPSLTARGRQEALAAHRDVLVNGLTPQLVVVSPITRATETAFLVFQHLLDDHGAPKRPVRFVAHEGLHERAGASTCDSRRPLSQLRKSFPHVDYSALKSEEDPLWSSERETQVSMITRLYEFLMWLRDCPEEEVAVVAHCSINFTLLNAVIDCGLDHNLAKWFCTAEVRSLRILWEHPLAEEAKFVDSESHIKGLADGFCCLYPHIVRLPQERDEDTVALRRDFEAYADSGRVAIVCGGGAGHEPLMSGFVGHGLLTASVTGALFASPSPGAILRAITAAAGAGGCVLLVKNYPGLRFNHGVAAQRARALGIEVEEVLIADDVGCVDPGWQGSRQDARGLVGALLALKAAGAAAERGDTAAEVAAAAQGVADCVRTMALALRWRGDDWSLELGVGIHGEPGAVELPSLTHLPGASTHGAATAAVQALMRQLLPSIRLLPSRRVVAVLNNLGGTSPLEIAVLCSAICKQLDLAGLHVEALMHGTLITCLDMHGVSLSLLPVDADSDMLHLLDAPAEAGSAWPGFIRPCALADRVVDADDQARWQPQRVARSLQMSMAQGGSFSTQLRTGVAAACEALVAESTVNALDAMDRDCGDADCGVTHRDAARVLLRRLGDMPDGPAHAALDYLAGALEAECRGAIGGIYVLGLEAAAQRLRDLGAGEPGPSAWAEAASAAAGAISRYGGAQRGDRTLLDALVPAVEALRKHAAEEPAAALSAAVAAAKTGAKDTQRMVARKGRAAHVPRSLQARCADPGAVALAKWLEAVEKALRSNGRKHEGG